MKIRLILAAAFTVFWACGMLAQSAATSPVFEVTTIKPASPDARGMSFTMGGSHRFLINNHTLKEVIATSYDVALRLISGGPVWIDPDRCDLEWTPDGAPAAANDADAKPDIFVAIQQFGLRLEPAKGQVEILVIDHVKRPDENQGKPA